MRSDIDVDRMIRAYDMGYMKVYSVHYFSATFRAVICGLKTLNAKVANDEIESLRKTGIEGWIEEDKINFHGLFQKQGD